MKETNMATFLTASNYQFASYQFNFSNVSMVEEQPQKPQMELKLKCEECTITYSSQKRYDNHIEKHHTKVCRHKCNYCRSSFKRRGKLTKHLSKAHPEMFYGKEAVQKPTINSKIKRSIFHSIDLLAQSDCSDLSSSSNWWFFLKLSSFTKY